MSNPRNFGSVDCFEATSCITGSGNIAGACILTEAAPLLGLLLRALEKSWPGACILTEAASLLGLLLRVLEKSWPANVSNLHIRLYMRSALPCFVVSGSLGVQHRGESPHGLCGDVS